MDIVAAENLFTKDFFCLTDSQNEFISEGIFKSSLDMLLYEYKL